MELSIHGLKRLNKLIEKAYSTYPDNAENFKYLLKIYLIDQNKCNFTQKDFVNTCTFSVAETFSLLDHLYTIRLKTKHNPSDELLKALDYCITELSNKINNAETRDSDETEE